MVDNLKENLAEDLKTLYVVITSKGLKNDIVELYSEKINNLFKIFDIEYSDVSFDAEQNDIIDSIENIYISINNVRIKKELFDCDILDYILDDLIYLLKTKF